MTDADVHAAHEPAAAPTRWRAVAAAVLAGITVGAAVGKIGPAIPALSAEFGLGMIAAGWLASMFNMISIGAALVAGIAIDRAGSLRACVFGLICVTAGGLIALAADGSGLVLAARIIEGAGGLAVVIAAPALISAATQPGERGLALGFWSSYLPLGAGLAVLAAPAFLLGPFGWRGLWAVNALAAAGALVFLLAESRHYVAARGQPRTLAAMRASLAQPVPWLLGIAFGMYTLQWHGVMIWLPTYLQDVRAIGPAGQAAATFAFIMVNIIGNQAGGVLIHRRVQRGRIIATAFAVTSLLFIMIFRGGFADAMRFTLVLVYSAATGVVASAALSGSARYARSPGEVGSLQGLLVQLSQTGVFVSPIAVAFAVTAGGSWDAALWVFLTAGAIGLACGLVILGYERRESN